MVKWLDNAVMRSPHFCLVQSEEDYHEACTWIDIAEDVRQHWIGGGAANGTLACVHTYYSGDELYFVVSMRVLPTDTGIDVAARLVHEAVHMWQVYSEHIGETIASHEFEAYSIQKLSAELMQQYAHTLTGATENEQA